MCTAAILAGGQGRRLGGQHKALLSVGRERIVDRQLAVLRAVVDRVVIVANDHERYRELGVPVWPDTRPGTGPLGGILTALVNATTDRTLVVGGDMPFLTADFLRYLITLGQDVDVVIPRTEDGYQPLCASYNRSCVPAIRRNLDAGILKVTEVLPMLRMREVDAQSVARFDPEGTLFFNINTPEDHARGVALVQDQLPKR